VNLPLFIARRYLFAKKSHNVINIISWISVLGMMVGTMAFIVILSVYNGFDQLVQTLYHTFDSDLVIRPKMGKYIDTVDPSLEQIRQDPSILAYNEVVEETVILQYLGRPVVSATMKGVDEHFFTHSPLVDYIIQGDFKLKFGDIDQAALGRGLATSLGVNVHFKDPLYLYFPSRSASVNLLNPQAALLEKRLFPAGIFSVEQNYDSKYFFVPLSLSREIMEYTTEASYIELRLQPNAQPNKVQARFAALLDPDDYLLLNRYQQNETLYKMMRTEKLVIYFLLLFVLLVITCNILGSIALLIMEKREDIETLKSMGASPITIKRIFLFEGWIIAFFGTLSGLILGVLLCFLQQRFGLIGLPGNYIINAYPIQVQWGDMLSVLGSVWIIGYVAARLSVYFFLTKPMLSAPQKSDEP